MPIAIKVLGALAVEVSGEPVRITAANERRALLYLAVHANEVVSGDQLADAVWIEHAPARVEHAVHSLVYRLRGRLREHDATNQTLRRIEPGYSLAIDPQQIDGNRFTSETRRGCAMLAGDPAAARDILSDALALWRGDALLDVAYDGWAMGEIRRLNEIRLTACESLAEANIELGDAQLSIAELESLTERFPTRESMWVLLWRALSATGRHLDVTASYQRAVELLADQCALPPSSHLAEQAHVYAHAD